MTNSFHLDLSRYIPILITRLAGELSKGAATSYRKYFGIGVIEWRLIALLAGQEKITANQICRITGLDKGAVSRSLRRLQSAGQISGKVDSADGRRYTVSLTAGGRALHDQAVQVALERERRLVSDLSTDEVNTLVDILGRMQTRVSYVNESEP